MKFWKEGKKMFVVNEDMFGRYVKIPHVLAGNGEKFLFKVVGRFKSNTYCNVPITSTSKPVAHDKKIKDWNDLEDVLNVIQCGVDETKVLTVALKDCEFVGSENNADRIRNMTNEELAEFLLNICTYCEDGEPVLSLCIGENCDIEIGGNYGDIKEWLENGCDAE